MYRNNTVKIYMHDIISIPCFSKDALKNYVLEVLREHGLPVKGSFTLEVMDCVKCTRTESKELGFYEFSWLIGPYK